MFPVIINKPGPLPIRMTFPWPSSSTVIVAVSGSAWTQKKDTMLAVEVTSKSTTVGTLQQFANPTATHLAFPTGFFAVQGEFGEFTLTLSAANSTTLTDQNDHFTVALIY